MTGSAASLTFSTGAVTHTGCVRTHNEDSIAAVPDLGLWVVADGMGGHDAGDIASRLIVEELSSIGVPVSAQDQRARALERLDRAHRRIQDHAAAGGLPVMGATLATLLIYGRELTCIWAGDSRIYLWRSGNLTPLTRDHSRVAQLIASGDLTEEQARSRPDRNVITRAVGAGIELEPETTGGTVMPQDRLLLCSDGLTEHLSDDELATILAGPVPPQQIADHLLQETLKRGAKDNVSIIVVDCSLP
ncbi:MAG: protein phosphatase 2C domain-containing protein [Paracoccus sp. (in: a-proteobacteria)]|uniref:PP2C family protein-serine/threonine phosphatase n=1 Tax=Paracoccus sp. TaxID=267 RepID=UPI0026E04C3F|nr:protein phosphatase 2C domain-containing protein [Paracoccus sp. (in: a-proteobacteria)]MDO5622820.1 protein phosphatase 2C domain-containing protein [Paracoccus sp. (in: a-proteobacteria)]